MSNEEVPSVLVAGKIVRPSKQNLRFLRKTPLFWAPPSLQQQHQPKQQAGPAWYGQLLLSQRMTLERMGNSAIGRAHRRGLKENLELPRYCATEGNEVEDTS
jgi:hypothetical protein